MLALLFRSLVTILLFVASGTVLASRGVVNANGVLKVKGADASSAKITIVPAGAAAYVLPTGTQRFTLDLPLDDTYLVSFERAGCPTKQVYFDTRVPGGQHSETFAFPFSVTLEYMTAESMFEYAGPVGYVRYMHPLIDFGYETEYLVKVESKMEERMAGMRSTGSDPQTFAQPTALFVVDRASNGGNFSTKDANVGDGKVAPIVSEVPRLVHVISSPLFPKKIVILPIPGETEKDKAVALLIVPEVPAAKAETFVDAIIIPAVLAPASVDVIKALPVVVPKAEPVLVPDARPVVAAEEVQVVVPTARPVVVPKALPVLAPEARPAIVVKEIRLELPAGAPVVRAAILAVLGSALREDDTIVGERIVTRRVRLTSKTGVINEYREVTHAYGAVFYFRNSGSITRRAFEAYIALD